MGKEGGARGKNSEDAIRKSFKVPDVDLTVYGSAVYNSLIDTLVRLYKSKPGPA